MTDRVPPSDQSTNGYELAHPARDRASCSPSTRVPMGNTPVVVGPSRLVVWEIARHPRPTAAAET
jgi:hypothetical protein